MWETLTPDPEVDLLVRCVDPAPDGSDEAGIRSLLADEPDWEHLLDLGRAHGVIPLVNRTLGSRFDDELPPDIRSSLAEQARSTALQNMRLATELHAIADDFEEGGIRWLPFKGPVLAEAVYGDLTHREFKDLDVLVHPEDLSRAVDRLEARGYEWRDGVPRLDDSLLLGGPFTKALESEYTLCRSGLELEVRCSVGDPEKPFTPAFGTLWSRRTTVDVAGQELPALAPTDRLLVLAFHGTKHNWHLLKWICDFGTAVVSSDVDWTRVAARSRRHGHERNLHLGLSLVETLFDIDVPRETEDRHRNDERIAALTRQVLTDLATGMPTRPSKRERVVFNAKASDSLRDWLPLLLGLSDVRPGILEYRLLPLPGVFHPLYYLVSPFLALGARCKQFAGNVRESKASIRPRILSILK